MRRPTGIIWTAALMLLAVLVGILHALFVQFGPFNSAATLHPHSMSPAALLLLVRIVGYGFAAFEFACIWAYWAGVEWARILVMIDCVLVIFALHRLAATYHRWPSMAVLEVGKTCLAVFLLWYLFRPQVRAWFSSADDKPAIDS